MAEDLGTGTVTITLDETGALGSANDLGDRIERILDRASRDAGLRIVRNITRAIDRVNPAEIRITADTSRFEAAVNGFNNLGSAPIRVTPDVDRARFEAAIAEALAGLEVSVSVVPDLDGFDARIRAHNAPDIRVGVDSRGVDAASGSVGKLSAALRSLGSSLGSVGALGGVLNDIRNLSGAAAALPAVIGAAGVAIVTLKLATNGLGEAFGTALTANTKDFEKALKDMTPAAQGAAKEIRALKPGFDALKASAQGAFLGPLKGSFTDLGKALSPLKGFVTNLAGAFGEVANEGVKVGTSKPFIDSLKASFETVTLVVQQLSRFVAPLGKAFSQMSTSVTNAFQGPLTSALSGAADKFTKFVDTADLGSKAVDWVSGAAVVFKSLGDVVDNVKGILGGLFDAASASGAQSFTGILGTLLGVLNEFVNSGPVQAALASLFQAFDTALGVIGPVLSSIASIAGPALQAIAEAVTPVIDALSSALLPILPPLAAAFSSLVTALTPIISLIGTTLADVIAAVAPLLFTLATTFGTIATALTPLITQLVDGLAPIFAQLAPIITQLVTALAPLIEALVAALLPVLPPIIDAFLAILNAVLPLLPPLASLVTIVLQFATTMITALAPVLSFIAGILSWTAINIVVPIIQGLVVVINGIIDVLSAVISAASSFVTSVVGFFSDLGSNVASIVSGLVSAVTGFLSSMWSTAKSLTSAGVSAVVGFFTALPGRARSALSSLGSALVGVITSASASVVSAVTSLVSKAVGLVKALPGKAKAALSGIGSALASAGRQLIQGMINGVKAMAGKIAGAAKAVVKGAIDGAKSILGIHSPSKVFHEIGVFTGKGFVNGLTSTEADIKRAAESVIGKIRDAFKGKNSKLDDRLIAQVKGTEKKLLKLADQRDKIAEKIKKANDLAASVSKNALQLGSLQNVFANADKNGGGIKGITEGIDQAITKVRTFNADINALAKKGLRKDLLSQIIGLGPDQGAKLADTLANASKGQIADLNAAQADLAKASKKLGQDSADKLFDAGKQASKGFLAGLKAQQKDVEDLMLSIARAMTKSIRKALGIKSPSKVFRGIGHYSMEGLGLGLEDRMRNVARTARGAASAITDPFGAAGSLGTGGTFNVAQRGAGSAGAGRTVTNNVTVNEVGDAHATAERVVQRLVAAAGL